MQHAELLLDIHRHLATELGRVYCPIPGLQAPPLCWKVDFPRLEIVLEGAMGDACLGDGAPLLAAGEAVYIPAGAWNLPVSSGAAKTLSILFGKQQIGFSIQRWGGEQPVAPEKYNVPRRGPRVGSCLLQSLNELISQPALHATARAIVLALLSHCSDLLSTQAWTGSRSKALFDAVRGYIDQHYQQPLTRESVSAAFYISPNYLSHLFQKTGNIGFNEYLTWVRLEQARNLLKNYDLKVKEIAQSCGFVDSNYFCRVFRKATDRSPSEYRRQYHSQLRGREAAYSITR